jgi:hypothetical protein
MQSVSAQISNLWNDLAILIEAEEAYNETYYNSEYARLCREIKDLLEQNYGYNKELYA